MREIKFRGKSVETGKWIYGDLVHNALTYKSMIVPVAIKNEEYYPIEVIPESVGQYIGRHDKNGKDIYEKDLVIEPDWWWGSGEVRLSIDENELNGDMQWIAGDCCNLWEQDEIEIIGNVCDNPELLEEHK